MNFACCTCPSYWWDKLDCGATKLFRAVHGAAPSSAMYRMRCIFNVQQSAKQEKTKEIEGRVDERDYEV